MWWCVLLALQSWNLTYTTFQALQILHNLGWVHRDISPGNLMMKDGQLKVADFEYAKKMTRPGGEVNGIRTVDSSYILKHRCVLFEPQGTEDFMSIEVRRQKYLFTTDKEDDYDDRGRLGPSLRRCNF